MIKLIASDLDGTLISGSMTDLPEGFPEVVRELKKRGIVFSAASGRQYHNLRCLFSEVKDDIAYICENGALTIYQDKILHKVEIPVEMAAPIIRRLEEERVCGYVENIGRDGTKTGICTLKELRDREANMFTTVFIGSSGSEIMNGKFVTKRGYRVESTSGFAK